MADMQVTDEMIAEFGRAYFAGHGDTRAGLAAVLAIVERDRKQLSTVRERLDAAIAESLPVSGGRTHKKLKQLRRVLEELDAERAATAAANRGRQ